MPEIYMGDKHLYCPACGDAYGARDGHCAGCGSYLVLRPPILVKTNRDGVDTWEIQAPRWSARYDGQEWSDPVFHGAEETARVRADEQMESAFSLLAFRDIAASSAVKLSEIELVVNACNPPQFNADGSRMSLADAVRWLVRLANNNATEKAG